MFKQTLTKAQVLQKLRHFCSYQDRCHSEVKEKLYNLGVRNTDHEEIIATLVEEGFLNEERFAMLFASGKFRLKQWGKVKIKHALKQKQVSEYCIQKALGQINEKDYNKTLYKLAEQKLKTLAGEKNIFIKKRKLQDYLLQKGYEHDLISSVMAVVTEQ
ncbi:MAG: RecX family transcriptional regulator [Bacteroidota bacterium]|nr:RecX family transcriptional regulator [Bacteroidota bacterium]